MIKIAVDFTKHGNFAAWESGSYNPMSDKGWAVLVADNQGKALKPIFQRTPQTSKHHSLFHVSIGSLVVVTNIRKMHNCDMFGIQIVIGRIDSLATRPGEKNPNQLEAVNEVHALCSESFLSEREKMSQRVGALKIAIHGMKPEVIENLQKMVALSVQKAMTLAADQHMFWGINQTPRVQRPFSPTNKKGKELPKEFVEDLERLRQTAVAAAEEAFQEEDAAETTEDNGVKVEFTGGQFSTDSDSEVEDDSEVIEQPQESVVEDTAEAGDEAVQQR